MHKFDSSEVNEAFSSAATAVHILIYVINHKYPLK